eukprot:1183474-Prorocentrum_minimum.AAC.3
MIRRVHQVSILVALLTTLSCNCQHNDVGAIIQQPDYTADHAPLSYLQEPRHLRLPNHNKRASGSNAYT